LTHRSTQPELGLLGASTAASGQKVETVLHADLATPETNRNSVEKLCAKQISTESN